MGYKAYYEEYLLFEREAKDASAQCVKYQKAVAKDMSKGDFKSAARNAASLALSTERAQESAARLTEKIASFDNAGFFQSGDFARALISCFEELDINVVGDFPVYEVFPFRVRIDAENNDVYLDRKKFSTSNPEFFALYVKRELDRLNSVSFNAAKFAGELEKGYDLCVAVQKKTENGSPVQLKSIYSALVPIARLRNSYTEQAFAFDIARLYVAADDVETKSGRKIEFGTDRNVSKSYRILNRDGREQFLGTVRFY